MQEPPDIVVVVCQRANRAAARTNHGQWRYANTQVLSVIKALASAAFARERLGSMAHELHDTGKATALLGICAQGGLGAAALLENAGAT